MVVFWEENVLKELDSSVGVPFPQIKLGKRSIKYKKYCNKYSCSFELLDNDLGKD